MAYYHVLVKKDYYTTRELLIFKDISEQELRTPFLVRFLREAHNAGAIRARVIRTERPHDDEARRYIWMWNEEAEKAMAHSCIHIDTSHGDEAIAGAGEDITATFLADVSADLGGHNRP